MVSQVLWLLLVIPWLWHQQGFAEPKNQTLSVKAIIDNLLDNGSYDHTIRPLYDEGQAVRVEMDVVLNTLGPVVAREMQMTASFYLRQQWRDPRLSFEAVNQTILLNHQRVKSIWLPDLFFSQAKTEARHEITVPNVLLRIHPDGTILFSQRLTVTFQCLMDLRDFPLDQQVCYIRMESYAHTTEDMLFAWSLERKSMDILENAHIPDFEITEITTHDCTATYATGTFPCLEARLKLDRKIGFYMIQTYIPCVLIVTLSWVSFWLDLQAIPARISVGLLTVLTITTQSSGARSQLPRVPYVKSIDVWLSVCLIFVFAAYIQYAFVTVFSRRHRKRQNCSQSSDTSTSDEKTSLSESSARIPDMNTIFSHTHNNGTTTRGTANGKTQNGLNAPAFARDQRRHSSDFPSDEVSRDLGRTVDKWSRGVFPLAFLMFNVGYWIFYTQSRHPEDTE